MSRSEPAGRRSARRIGRRHHDHRSHRRRRPHGRREAQRQASQLARCRSGVRSSEGGGGAQPARPGPGRRRDHGMRDAGGRAVAQHRSQRRAGRRLARVGAGYHRRPPVRVVTAGGAFRRPRCHRRGLRHRDRRRRGVDDEDADGLLGRARARVPLRAAHDAALHRDRAARSGHRRRDDRRPVGHLARRTGRLLGPEPPSAPPGPRPRDGSRTRSCPSRCATTRATTPTRC